jgi:hypothetical protein
MSNGSQEEFAEAEEKGNAVGNYQERGGVYTYPALR